MQALHRQRRRAPRKPCRPDRRRDRGHPARHRRRGAGLHEGHAESDGVLMAAFQERPMGFFTDTSICIGCKACEVACKEWNQLEGNKPELLLDSFDNTGQLDAQNWRHVEFIEHIPDNNGVVMTPTPIAGGQAWLMMSDVCKHCQNASCLEVCPTNAIVRTENDSFFLLLDGPEVYKLPSAQNATLPSRNNFAGYAGGFVTAVLGLVAGVLAFRSQRMNEKTDATR